ncbi:WXG100 family type VII secretion target [Sporosarcina pasteurii]|uniref:Virulence factor EsxB n=1 Tax=Sporosarcina pasteurii TaxID=1474 RepID=A0A380BB55_SPOPA|nr:WXG100 family type VII secretion target [Sporosarcina pasteurii]MDS9473272.1 WXG100 family type VII secretion target [Sporosarcina pasteurii]QBQ06504.1 WXG100 family type VII secretion target [Sporosarcina pasteurii]SUI98306.1 Virulence factor EsxB [Sporosarcina pasteurii]
MGNVKIDGRKVDEALAAAKSIEASIKSTAKTCESLLSFVRSANWSGNSRDSFLSYLEIILPYHKEMIDAVEKQTKALNNLEGYINDFQQDSSVKEVRSL